MLPPEEVIALKVSVAWIFKLAPEVATPLPNFETKFCALQDAALVSLKAAFSETPFTVAIEPLVPSNSKFLVSTSILIDEPELISTWVLLLIFRFALKLDPEERSAVKFSSRIVFMVVSSAPELNFTD